MINRILKLNNIGVPLSMTGQVCYFLLPDYSGCTIQIEVCTLNLFVRIIYLMPLLGRLIKSAVATLVFQPIC